MKTIKDIDAQIVGIDDVPEGVTLPSFRKLLKSAVGMVAGKNSDDAVDLYQVGMKLRVDGADVALEDAEFKLLKDACDKNPAQWMSHYHAQVILKLREAEKA